MEGKEGGGAETQRKRVVEEGGGRRQAPLMNPACLAALAQRPMPRRWEGRMKGFGEEKEEDRKRGEIDYKSYCFSNDQERGRIDEDGGQ